VPNNLTRFSDVVSLSTARTADPLAAGIGRFVGLEHIEPENLHIRNWGLVADGTTFTNTFKRGQILFGKRRAYQRKVAVADFDGVCSGDIYVFESKDPNVLLPELVPFICQSEGFFEFAVKTSAGSLSPRTNWSHLANYEFPLPPLDEQRRIADLLWAADDAISGIVEMMEKAETLKTATMDKLLSKGTLENPGRKNSELGDIPVNWQVCAIEEKLEAIIDYRGKTPEKSSSGIPLVTARNIRAGYIDPEPREFIAPETYKERMTRGIPKVGDIFFTTEAPLGMVAKVPDYKFSPGQRIITLRGKSDELDSGYLYWLLLWRESQQRIQQKSHGTTVTGIKQSVFRKVIFRFPPLNEQIQISKTLDLIQNTIYSAEQHLQNQKALRKSLLEESVGNSQKKSR
jgi:type I restriction enzyme, S subunit